MKNTIRFMLFITIWLNVSVSNAQISPSPNHILYVDAAVSGGTNSGSSWGNAIPNLADALKWARTQYVNDSTWLNNDSLQIWIAQGTYFPMYNANDLNYTTNGNINNSFVMLKNVQLFGGFNPVVGDSTMQNRDWIANPCILDGNIGLPNDSTDNCVHTVIAVGSLKRATIDGFTITNGYAYGSSQSTQVLQYYSIMDYFGGGLYNNSSSIRVSNCVFTKNNAEYGGGGVYSENTCTPLFNNVSFQNNITGGSGGGMYNYYNSFPTLINTVFKNNTSSLGGGMNVKMSRAKIDSVTFEGNTATSGGALYCTFGVTFIKNSYFIANKANIVGGAIVNQNQSDIHLLNVSIERNTASQGGAIYNMTNSNPNITNVTIANNSATTGGGIYNIDSSSPTIVNTVLFGNKSDTLDNNIYNYPGAGPGNESVPEISYSYVEGVSIWNPLWGTDNGGNIISATLPFVDTASNNFSLVPTCPAINFSSNSLYTSAGGNLSVDVDLAGNQRLFGDSIDMGAFESQNDFASISNFSPGNINEKMQAIVFPNPFHSTVQLEINLPSSSNANIALMNVLGEIKYKSFHQLKEGKNTIDFEHEFAELPSGSYMLFVQLQSGKNFVSQLVKY